MARASLLTFFSLIGLSQLSQGFLHANVISRDFPDPSILRDPVSAVYYAYATRNDTANIPIATTTSFPATTWKVLPQDAFPTLGSWVIAGGKNVQNCWAPDVFYISTNSGPKYAMYYSAVEKTRDQHCVGIARSSSPQGPFVDTSTAPFLCPPPNTGGALDASAFLDTDGKRYVVYKSNGGEARPANTSTPLVVQQTTADGGTLVGTGTTLWNNAGASDDYVVEAPIFVLENGVYFLFFSSGNTFGTDYTISYVTSTTGIRGPYGQRTVLMKGEGATYCGQSFVSPGGMDITKMSGRQMVFHQGIAGTSGGRTMNTATLSFSGRVAGIVC